MTDKKFYRYICFFLALFVAGRYIYLKQIWDTPILTLPVLDADYYFRWAHAIAGGYGSPPGVYWLSPLYSHVLAALFAATGLTSVGLAVIFNVILSVVTFLLLIITTRKLWGEMAAVVTAGLCVIYSPWLYYDGMMLTASLILCINAALLFVLISMFPLTEAQAESKWAISKVATKLAERQWLLIAFAGALTGLSALARPSILIFAVLFSVWLWRNFLAARNRLVAAYLAALVLVLSPVLIRNWMVSGTPTLTTAASGINFYIGNRSGASGIYDDLSWVESSDPQREAEAYRDEASKLTGDSLTLAQANRYWGQRAWADIFSQPGAWIKLVAKKVLLTIQDTEYANNLSFRAVASYAPIVGALPLRWGLLLPLAAVSLLLFWPRRVPHYLWLYALTYVLTGVIFFCASEYRFPLILLLLPAAAYFLVQIWHLLAAKNFKMLAAACGVYLGTLLIVNWPSSFARERAHPGMDFQNLGTVAQDHGLIADAIPLYARALAVNDSLVQARIGLADCLWKLGNFDDARTQYELAGVAPPDTIQGAPLVQFMESIHEKIRKYSADSALAYIDSLFPYPQQTPSDILLLRAELLEKMKRYSQALVSYQLVIPRDPENPELLHRAGLMAAWIDDHVLADSLYRAAIRLYPAYAPSRIELGLLAYYRGDGETARAQVQELSKISIPDDSLKARAKTLADLMARRDELMPE